MTLGRLAMVAVVGALAFTAAATSALSASAVAPGAIFRVRPDLRMCPSPMCGGYWVAQANRATIACGDGTTRAWCYVAGIALPKPARSRDSMLARGRIVHIGDGEIRPIDRFMASEAWLGATRAPATGTVYLVSDNGIRCVRAPCPSLRVLTVNTKRAALASGLDLSGVAASPALKRKAQTALMNGGLLVAGVVRWLSDVTRVVVAKQFFLPAS